MENQHDYAELIERFLEGALSDDELVFFKKQLESDPEMAEVYRQRIALQELWVESTRRGMLKKQIGQVIAREKQSVRARRNIWLAAAAVVVLSVIGSLLIFNTRNTKPEEQYAAGQETPLPATEGKQNQMNEYGNIDIVKPAKSVDDFFPDEYTPLKSNDTIVFRWPSSMETRYLTIYNNKGELVKKVTIRKKVKEYMLLPGVLKPGIYYWKMMNDSTLIRITVQ
ncbi:MAG: hypothetical protein AB2L17_01360 [Lentimicrobium sp.]